MAGDKGEFMRVMVNPAVYGVLKYIFWGGKFVELSFRKYDGRDEEYVWLVTASRFPSRSRKILSSTTIHLCFVSFVGGY